MILVNILLGNVHLCFKQNEYYKENFIPLEEKRFYVLCFAVNCLTDDDLIFELFVQYTCLEM